MEFKVDDWVRVRDYGGNESIIQFHNGQAFADGWYKSVELWKPKKDDFLFATDKSKIYVVRFLHIHDNKYVCVHLDGYTEYFEIVRPFRGTLPNFLHEI